MDNGQSFGLYPVPVMGRVDEHGDSKPHTRDEVDMARLGKKQVLKVRPCIAKPCIDVSVLTYGYQRNFGFMSMLGFSCTMMVTWEAILMWVTL